MRSLKILFLSLCIVSSFGLAEGKERRSDRLSVAETKAQNGFPNVFRSIGNSFKRLFGIKQRKSYCELPASVAAVDLNLNEITVSCSLPHSARNNVSQNNSQLIKVLVAAVTGEKSIFVYQVSGGKIIGNGANVMWDLSNAKVGTYTITAGIDSGDGIIGRTLTKEVKVIECPAC